MRKPLSVLLCILLSAALLNGCGKSGNLSSKGDTASGADSLNGAVSGVIASNSTDLGDDSATFGEELQETGVYNGYFEGESSDISVECVLGTEKAYSVSGSTITFSNITEDTAYSISGTFNGNIVIDVNENCKFELELNGFTLKSTDVNPIRALSGNKVTITAKKGSVNYIYDMRDAVDDTDDTLTKSAIHSAVDLQIGGKGSLTVVSENNNGIHSKDDLEVKNLTLTVACEDNALKGNDSVELTDGTVTLIAKTGDGIKTTSSDISSKGNQRGTVSINGTVLTVYAACDGIDASYNAEISGDTTSVTVYTDKYSNYSNEVTATSSSEYYIRYSRNTYKYSVKYYNSDSDYEWVNATYHSTVSGGMNSYYYYSYPVKEGYSKVQFFVYSSNMEQGQEDEFVVSTDYLTLNTAYDTIALSSRSNNISFQWTNYTTSFQGGMGGHGGIGGGMNDGNKDKGDYSTKGIKAANEIIISGGTVNIKSYDDSLHADNSETLENGAAALGNITVSGGKVTLYSNDDGIHAENTVYVKGGTVDIENSYEGIEGSTIFVSGGNISVYSKDDGINSTATSGTGITLSGGFVYIYCNGDGIDTNSRSSYTGISFEGGDAIIIANSSGNSAIDTEQGYKYSSGSIVAIMPRGGMTGEATHCNNFNSVGTSKSMSFVSGSALTVSGDMKKTVTMPCTISNAFVVILNKNISISN